jgi:hypothetical protein
MANEFGISLAQWEYRPPGRCYTLYHARIISKLASTCRVYSSISHYQQGPWAFGSPLQFGTYMMFLYFVRRVIALGFDLSPPNFWGECYFVRHRSLAASNIHTSSAISMMMGKHHPKDIEHPLFDRRTRRTGNSNIYHRTVYIGILGEIPKMYLPSIRRC